MKQINSNNSRLIFEASNYNILIVEDSKSSNKLIDISLTKIGYKCFNAFTLEEARKILKETTIHFIMLDINLPDGNGFELIKEFQNTDTKIFVLTSETDANFIHSTFQKGVVDFLAKGKYFFNKINKITNTIEQLEKNRYKTILILDSDTSSHKQLKDLFENRNYTVKFCSSESISLEIINEEMIDLILLDTNFENETGIEYLEKNENNIIIKKNIPVMITSNSSEPLIIRDGLNAGAIDIIKKPYIIEEIILKVDLWIKYKSKEEEALISNQLIEEYKSVVDESSIVSKTDIAGKITYVNDRFLKLSGFTKEELIGKTHSIVKHQDMGSEIFKDMWHTIKDLKKTWKGKVKNRKKDGSHYWVNAVIKPVLDVNGDIQEYIALRNDITELENYKDILKSNLDDTTKSLTANLNYTLQYEEAINQSTAIIKTGTDNIITFANEKFCELSGYTENELTGMNCQALRHENHIKLKDCKNLKDSLSKNEHVSIRFTNVAKDGSLYFLDTIVYPITETNREVSQHLHLMHDITELTNLHKEIEDTQKEIVYKMGEIGESRSKETGNHVKRVAEYSKLLAQLHGLSEQECDTLFTSSPMHDIGKVAIPDSILKKPGKLTEAEFEIMKSHAEIGYSVLKGSKREVLRAAAIVAYEHHEKYNGKGYPQGLKGEDIHIFGRITAIADVFDALGSDRVYKSAWSDEEIFELFRKEKSEHFDPQLIDLFFENLELFLKIRDRYKD